VRNYVLTLASGVKRRFWFSAQTSWSYSNGIYFHDYIPRPEMGAYAAMAERLEGARFVRSLKLPSLPEQGVALSGYLFESKDGPLAVAWSRNETAVIMELDPANKAVEVIDLMGNRWVGRRLKVGISPTPCYFIGYDSDALSRTLQTPRTFSAGSAPVRVDVLRGPKPLTIAVRLLSRSANALDGVITLKTPLECPLEEAEVAFDSLAKKEQRDILFMLKPGSRASGPMRVTAEVLTGSRRLVTVRCEKEIE